jgi:hypothetical protein
MLEEPLSAAATALESRSTGLEMMLTQFAQNTRVLLPAQEHVSSAIIAEKGGLFRVLMVQYWFMEPQACHDNVLYLYERHKIKHMCIGYALAPDRQWRYHSWGLGHDGRLIETTAPFLLYFGCIMVK